MLSLDEILNTDWAKTFQQESLAGFQEVLQLLKDPDFKVGIRHNNETGDWQWSVEGPRNFWMWSYDTLAEARILCAQMGWPVVSITDDYNYEGEG